MSRFTRRLCAVLLISSLMTGVYALGKPKTKLTYWFFPVYINVPGFESHSAAHGDWEKFLATEYMKSHPDVEISAELQPWEGGVDKVNVAIAGGNPPDIVVDYLGRTGSWYTQGAGVPLDNVISQKMKDDIQPSFKGLYTINGKLHAYPMMAWVQMLLTNSFVYDKYKVALPPSGSELSTDQFKAILASAKKNFPQGVYPYGLGCGTEQGDYVWWAFIWGFGGRLFDDAGKVAVNSPQTLEALKYLQSLDKEGLLAPGTATMAVPDLVKLLYSNKLGGWMGNKGNLSNLNQAYKDGTIEGPPRINLYPFPTKTGKPMNAIGPTGFIVMTKDAAKQKIAADFMEFCLQPKYHAAAVKAAGQLPATKSVAAMDIYKGDELGQIAQQLVAKYPAGDFGVSNPNYNKIRKELSVQLQAMFADMKTPEKTVADLDAAIRKIVGQ